MTPPLERRLRFVEQRGARSGELPWLRHKVLQLELWTGAYMLDRWEAVAIFLVPVVALVVLASYLGLL